MIKIPKEEEFEFLILTLFMNISTVRKCFYIFGSDTTKKLILLLPPQASG